jgi:two-component sensor histidine kinase
MILVFVVAAFFKSNAQQYNTCLHFNGRGSHISIPSTPAIAIDSGTVEIWFKNHDTLTLEWQSLVSKTLAYQITIYYDSLSVYDWKNKKVHNFPKRVNDNQWHHAAFVFRKNILNGSQLYLDGVPLEKPFTYDFIYNGNELQIGGNNYEPQYFNGNLDDFRLWNIPKTAQEIKNNYTKELIGNEEGLVIYYKFSDGVANENNFNVAFVKDETSNNLDGKLMGFQLKDSYSNFINDSPINTINNNKFLKYLRKNKTEVILIIIGLFVVGLLFYIRLYYLKKRNKKLESLVEERTKELRSALEQKDFLLQEVHHRVKNNLQMMSTMLQLEIENDRTTEQQKPLLETSRRLHCMSLVHQQLYRKENVEQVNAKSYIITLVQSINELVNTDNMIIDFKLNIVQVDLPITKCLPIGFIISEMVSNSIQHAFDNHFHEAIITIDLIKENSGYYKLIIKDNGKGVAYDNLMEIKNKAFNKSLGLRLVDVFARQLNGSLNFNVNNGFGVIISFKP